MDIHFEDSLSFARAMDAKDPLAAYRDKFHVPKKGDLPIIYFSGNSLGLQPKVLKAYIDTELDQWASHGVEGHFTGALPWVDYHQATKQTLSRLVGAKEHEVVSMNSLTVNLHLLLASFYQPKGIRRKILMEKGAFPSDHFAVQSHMEQKGASATEDLILLEGDANGILTTEFIINEIDTIGDNLALVVLPGVQYYTGQYLDMAAISKGAHAVGAFAGFDLAHAIGNVPMRLHDDEVDFATWCSYKYLNAGPGAVSGLFIHEKHANDPAFPRLQGWWGHDRATRFLMDNHFIPNAGADGWMLSNCNVLSTAALRASLDIFEEVGIETLRQKSLLLTGYLEHLLISDPTLSDIVQVITPSDTRQRGCQLSLVIQGRGKEIFHQVVAAGVMADWREPNVMRIAPTPLYNSFEEVYLFADILKKALHEQ